MAKKTQPAPAPKPPDRLTIPKGDFRASLQKRLEVGEELLSVPINTEQDLTAQKTKYTSWDYYNSDLLKSSFNNEDNDYRGEYDGVNFYSNMFGASHDAREILNSYRKDFTKKLNCLRSIQERIEIMKEDPSISSASIPLGILPTYIAALTDNKKVFIVHGHDTAIQQSVARVITKLKLTPVILSEQANGGKTVIEKFEQHAEVGFAVVLLTADDQGKANKESDFKSRARQNVILELGYFIGKIGRDKVMPLYGKGVELPSDLHGIIYTLIDDLGRWELDLAKELRHAGYSVDANDLFS